eukprot:gene14260-16392_t
MSFRAFSVVAARFKSCKTHVPVTRLCLTSARPYSSSPINSAQVTFSNGSVYTGDLADKKRHGLGKNVYINQTIYQGEWFNDKPHGRGMVTAPNGSVVYKGHFSNGVRKGEGESYEAEGSYTGLWENNLKHGKGTMHGLVYDGQVVDGERHGMGRTQYPDGTSYSGDYKSDLENGTGLLMHPNGSSYMGDFVQGKSH